MNTGTGIKNAALLLALGIFVSFSSTAAQDERAQGRFDEHQRQAVRDYYSEQQRRGVCPPGLAKKNNGCNPPGQLRQWQRGQVLPSDVILYDLSRTLELQLGRAPAGYRYGSVDDNILLIELGTQLVVDVIQALGQ